jgi:RNA polymerase sigma-70 factor (TIGR02960 family)
MLDEATFASLTAKHRRELHVHGYRMLGNFDAAEDALQEALLRAWRGRASFDGGPGARAWLYRIVTTTCLDMLRKAGREAVTAESIADLAWLTPYPDVLLDEAGPEDLAVRRETIELAYLAVIQLLPARQRAVLLLRDVQGYSAAETAAALGMSVAAANSALQRARATLAERLPERDASWSTDGLTEADRDLLAAFIDTHQRQDPAASLALIREDVRISMPPQPVYFTGREKMVELVAAAFDRARFGEWRLLPTAANRMPAAASYLLRDGATEWIAFKLDVIRVAGGRIAETTTFDHSLFPAFGLPLTLPLS